MCQCTYLSRCQWRWAFLPQPPRVVGGLSSSWESDEGLDLNSTVLSIGQKPQGCTQGRPSRLEGPTEESGALCG